MISRICPPPPDCPLYDTRLDYGADEPLRRAVLTERPKARAIAELVWADFNGQRQRVKRSGPPTRPALPPVEPSPIFDHLTRKGARP